jgi:hypothetical protein
MATTKTTKGVRNAKREIKRLTVKLHELHMHHWAIDHQIDQVTAELHSKQAFLRNRKELPDDLG